MVVIRGAGALRACLACLLASGGGADPGRFQMDSAADERAQRGLTQLQVLRGEAASQGLAGSALASCWATALNQLESGCRKMDDTTQSRLAVEFANCHLAKSGLDTYPCAPEMTIQACTKPMVDSTNGLAFSTYTLFYTHTESICFYLQSKAFQESTEAAVNALHTGAREAGERLLELQRQAADIGGRTSDILNEQQAVAVAQHELLRGQREAREELTTLQQAQVQSFAEAETALQGLGAQSRSALEDLKRDTSELSSKQRSLLGGVERLLGLQDALLGEFMDTKSVIFYTCAVILSLALSSTQRTASARLPLFALLTGNVLAEKMLVALLLGGAAADGTDAARVHAWLWCSRRLFGTLCGLALVGAALRYTNLGQKTVALLGEVRQLQRQSTLDLGELHAQLRELLERERRRADGHRTREVARQALHSALARAHRRRAATSPSPAVRSSPAASGMRPSKSPVRAAPQPAPDGTTPPAFERASTAATVVLGSEEAGGGGICLDAPRDESERAESRVSGELERELTRANLERFAGRSSLTPARKARRHSHSTEEATPTRRSERIAKQRDCASSIGGMS